MQSILCTCTFVNLCAMILMQRSNQNNAPDSPSSCAKSFSFNITAFQIDCLIIVLELHSVWNSPKNVLHQKRSLPETNFMANCLLNLIFTANREWIGTWCAAQLACLIRPHINEGKILKIRTERSKQKSSLAAFYIIANARDGSIAAHLLSFFL